METQNKVQNHEEAVAMVYNTINSLLTLNQLWRGMLSVRIVSADSESAEPHVTIYKYDAAQDKPITTVPMSALVPDGQPNTKDIELGILKALVSAGKVGMVQIMLNRTMHTTSITDEDGVVYWFECNDATVQAAIPPHAPSYWPRGLVGEQPIEPVVGSGAQESADAGTKSWWNTSIPPVAPVAPVVQQSPEDYTAPMPDKDSLA